MDSLLFALIESEREADEAFIAVSDGELGPVDVIADDDASRVEIYADGSYAAFGPSGALL